MNKVLKTLLNFVTSETARKVAVELIAEIVATTISKLISGGWSAPHIEAISAAA